ncbi:MAG: Cell wall hydrolase, sleb, partial [Parcubacteria group bacterium GW2011_GWA2_40_14]
MNKKTFFRTFFVGLTVAVMLPTLVLAVVSDVDPDDGGSQCVLLNFNLKYRSRDANTNGEVSTLQDFLQSQNYLSSEPTGYFGILTLKAVKDFQRDNGITPTGYVGPITRAKINALCGDVTSGGGGGGGGG